MMSITNRNNMNNYGSMQRDAERRVLEMQKRARYMVEGRENVPQDNGSNHHTAKDHGNAYRVEGSSRLRSGYRPSHNGINAVMAIEQQEQAQRTACESTANAPQCKCGTENNTVYANKNTSVDECRAQSGTIGKILADPERILIAALILLALSEKADIMLVLSLIYILL